MTKRTPDLTMRQPAASPGVPVLSLFICGHKGTALGARFKRGMPYRCARCVAARTCTAAGGSDIAIVGTEDAR